MRTAKRMPRDDRGTVITPQAGDVAPDAARDPVFRVRRRLLVDIEMVVSAPDSQTAAFISDLVLSDLTIHADCARLLDVAAHGRPVVEPGGSDIGTTIGMQSRVWGRDP